MMNPNILIHTIKALLAEDKGLLAMDESNGTCNKRLGHLGIPQTEESRRTWRELILTTKNLSNYISGVILYDETIRQYCSDGRSFVKVIGDAGMMPGIKVDIGTTDMEAHAGEKVTQGLDGLRERLAEYVKLGARFAKWRAVFSIGVGLPSRACIEANALVLARYAALCQEAGLVPIIEPEVLMQGDHTLSRCKEVTEEVLREVFIQLYTQGVSLEGVILKSNMVLSGLNCPKQESLEEIADATVACLLQTVPAAVPAILFLSGGQTGDLASLRLNAMSPKLKPNLPWPLSFSFARAIQNPAMAIWSGNAMNVINAQDALIKRAMNNQASLQGHYTNEMSMDHEGLISSVATVWNKNILNKPLESGNRPTYVFGNWKMNTNQSTAKELAQAIADGIAIDPNMIVAIFPPSPYLGLVGNILKNSCIGLGGQNIYPELEGAFTGEVSPNMLIDVGCKYVIIGHSERRQILGETDAFINRKVCTALNAGLHIILCVGETLVQRKANKTNEILNQQVMQGLEGVIADNLHRVIIAYEPIWAIGHYGQNAMSSQLQAEGNLIRYCIGQMYGQEISQSLIVLYGGNVTPENAIELDHTEGLDGFLIGGNSLNSDQFLGIIETISNRD